ncbi:hypothetical protein [Rhizobium fabae]|uniref:Uncharacterized protein n=1 Tax=Rhizobium fabae TaxID=573179 RepID=A0A7W6B7I8_9HYPH|nr:hypothetical protein [Rhizobium fabae]MBB3912931.1 hypothetical protein [Rhizobium fabae]RUM15222.1 hypothetical protein EFB14_03950 [Rhizobium fabae]
MTTIRTLDPPWIARLRRLAKAATKGNAGYDKLSHAGSFLLRPLGNLGNRGRLITGQFIILAALLAFAAASASMSALAAASLVVAASSAATHPGYHPVPIRSRYARTTSVR